MGNKKNFHSENTRLLNSNKSRVQGSDFGFSPPLVEKRPEF